jgi:hypothetical protein
MEKNNKKFIINYFNSLATGTTQQGKDRICFQPMRPSLAM